MTASNPSSTLHNNLHSINYHLQKQRETMKIMIIRITTSKQGFYPDDVLLFTLFSTSSACNLQLQNKFQKSLLPTTNIWNWNCSTTCNFRKKILLQALNFSWTNQHASSHHASSLKIIMTPLAVHSGALPICVQIVLFFFTFLYICCFIFTKKLARGHFNGMPNLINLFWWSKITFSAAISRAWSNSLENMLVFDQILLLGKRTRRIWWTLYSNVLTSQCEI